MVGQVLHELGLEVEACPEIFSALEKLTTKTFEVVVADMDDGAEANFLLKTCRELNSTSAALSVAIAGVGVSAAQPGVGLVINKPLIPERVKWSFQHCEQLSAKKKTEAKREYAPAPIASKKKPPAALPVKIKEPLVVEPPKHQLVLEEPGDLTEPDLEVENGLVPLAESASAKFHRTSHSISLTANAKDLGFLDKNNPLHIQDSRANRKGNFSRFYRPSLLSAVMLWLAYVGIEPARSAALVTSVAVIYSKAVVNTETWLQEQRNNQPVASTEEEVTPVHRPRVQQRVEVIHLEPQPSPIPPVLAGSPKQPATAGAESAIPNSLKSALQSPQNVPAVDVKLGPPSILNGMQPVLVPEELSRNMILDKVQPDYPQQALSAGVQGPVVLQAWIGKDGKVTDLKLVRGYMVLGKAASDAVRRWRFKPYVLNGQAVETQTYITVDFKLPNT